MDRNKFDFISLKHYDASIFRFKETFFAICLYLICFIINAFFRTKLTLLSMHMALAFLYAIFFVAMFDMILFCYDYYIGQNKRIKKIEDKLNDVDNQNMLK